MDNDGVEVWAHGFEEGERVEGVAGADVDLDK